MPQQHSQNLNFSGRASLVETPTPQKNILRAATALRLCNSALAKSQSTQELKQAVCDIIAQTDGYAYAWIGSVDEKNNRQIIAQAGLSSRNDAIELNSSCQSHMLNCRVMENAIETNQAQLIQMLPANNGCEACQQNSGFNAFVAIPITFTHISFGILNIYCNREYHIEYDELIFLESIADSLAYALNNLKEKKRYEIFQTDLDNSNTLIQEKLLRQTNELNLARNKLKEMDMLKSLFVASISHELRTPLNAIIGFSGILLNELPGQLNTTQKDHLNRVYQSGKQLLYLVSEVIDISKLQGHRIEVDPQPLILNKLIQEIVETFKNDIQRKGISIEISMNEKIFLYNDHHRLKQCIQNLVSNAVKYTETGSIKIVVKENVDEVTFSIKDTGIGIEEHSKSKVFNAFERLDTHLKVKAGGAGLGLYVTRKIINEVLQGTISFESELNKGSIFRFCIPRNLTRSHVEQYICNSKSQ